MGGGMIFGSMIASGIIHGTGFATGRVPFEMMMIGQIMIGAWAGSRFADFDWGLFGRTLMASTLANGAGILNKHFESYLRELRVVKDVFKN